MTRRPRPPARPFAPSLVLWGAGLLVAAPLAGCQQAALVRPPQYGVAPNPVTYTAPPTPLVPPGAPPPANGTPSAAAGKAQAGKTAKAPQPPPVLAGPGPVPSIPDEGRAIPGRGNSADPVAVPTYGAPVYALPTGLPSSGNAALPQRASNSLSAATVKPGSAAPANASAGAPPPRAAAAGTPPPGAAPGGDLPPPPPPPTPPGAEPLAPSLFPPSSLAPGG